MLTLLLSTPAVAGTQQHVSGAGLLGAPAVIDETKGKRGKKGTEPEPSVPGLELPGAAHVTFAQNKTLSFAGLAVGRFRRCRNDPFRVPATNLASPSFFFGRGHVPAGMRHA